MSDLPDINTSNVGFIAYWNAIDDGGATSIAPEDMLTDGNINSYTLYDNGFTADYTNPINSLPVTVRAKTDGWITAHTTREENYSFGSGVSNTFTDVRGWYNFATGDEDQENINPDLSQNALERSIYSLQSNLSNTNSFVYSTADVSLYNYEYPNATDVTLANVGAQTYGGSSPTKIGGISATSTTTLDAAVVFARASGGTQTVEFGGNIIAKTGPSASLNHATADLLTNNFFDATGTEKELYANVGNYSLGSITAIIIWH
jgi:hypothetical protein